MQRRMNRGADDGGMTLIELAVAVLILALGTVAALRAADQSAVAISGAEDRMLAQLAVRNRAEELQLLGTAGAAALADRVVLNGQTFVIATRAERTAAGLTEATITARAEGGGGARLVIYLAPRTGL